MEHLDTSTFLKELFKDTFSREKFLDKAVESKVSSIMVGTQFFPERAMYWTRMFKEDADKRGVNLEAIICESELLTDSLEILEGSLADLSEWVRISALSKIPNLLIKITGWGPFFEDDLDFLSHSLLSVVHLAKQYKVMLVFSDETTKISDDNMLSLIRKLGYSNCRFVPKNDVSEPADKVWLF